jgi:hypothetical protein
MEGGRDTPISTVARFAAAVGAHLEIGAAGPAAPNGARSRR